MKSIPIALQMHKAQPVTTLCELVKMGPLPDNSFFGITSLDIDVTYNDGAGDIVYRAHTGFSGSSQTSTADLGVDNAEAQTLIAEFSVPGVTQAMVDRGILDKVPYIAYRVNYKSLSAGHEITGSGTLGEQTVKPGGLVVLELRGISQQLRQSVIELDSQTCRVKNFGSQPGEERFPCGYNIAPEWVYGTVSVSGPEATRQFESTAFTQPDGYFAPGIVEMLTGANAGSLVEIEEFTRLTGAATYTEITTGIDWTQSSVFSGLTATAANMRDSSSTTGAATTQASNPEWIRADLGAARTIGRIAVAGGNLSGWGAVALFLNARTVQYSIDGTTGWTTVSTVAGVNDTGALFDFTFSAVSARYWRISSVTWVAAAEFRLYEYAAGSVIGGLVTLQFTVPFVILAGDTFRIRRDCTRAWKGHNSCATYHAAAKGLHFRGEPDIPVADALQVPGAEA